MPDNLKKNGWHFINHDNRKLNAIIQRVMLLDPEYHISPITKLYENSPPIIFAIYEIKQGEAILELELWKSNIKFLNGTELFIGTTTLRKKGKYTITIDSNKYVTMQENDGINQIIKGLQNAKYKVLTYKTKNQPAKIQKLNWNNTALLIHSQKDF